MPEEVFETPQPVTEPKPTNWPKMLLAAVLGSVLLAAAVYSGYWYGTTNSNLKTQSSKPTAVSQPTPLPTPTPEPTPTQVSAPKVTSISEVVSAVQSEFEEYKKSYDSEIYSNNDFRVWWVSSDGLNIINENSSGTKLQLFNCEPGAASEPNFKEAAQEIGLRVDEVLRQGGFVANPSNSSESVEDGRFYDYVQAYQKGETRCVFTASPDCGRAAGEDRFYYGFSFTCTDQFASNYQEQAPYLTDLGIKNAIISVAKKLGAFVRLEVGGRRTGYYVIAKLISGKWTEVYAGQATPTCEVVKQYQVPSEICGICWDQDTGEILQNKIP